MTNLEKLRAAIIEAVPEIEGCGDWNCHDGHYPYPGGEDGSDVDWGACPTCVRDGIYDPPTRPITLEDVLKAYPGWPDIWGNDDKLHEFIGGYNFSWKMGKTLDDQSPECIDFLTSVLCKD